ncbi:hypothetical protein OG470_20540 [Micromonospora sp. NBC_00389]|uniref:hypothetical protein n=1 Tax=Micromonospora sp. NBC_00389 TaxID=2903586 RepID=UPI002E1C3DBB
MSLGGPRVRVVVAVVVLLLLPLLLLGTTVANWVAVDQAVDTALRHDSGAHRYFIETYGSGIRGFLVLGAVLQLGIAVALLSVGAAVLEDRRSVKALAITTPWVTICCGLGALTINPVTNVSWVGEPDGESIVGNHFPAWHWPVLCTLLVLIVLCCVTTTILFATTRSAEFRQARDPA